MIPPPGQQLMGMLYKEGLTAWRSRAQLSACGFFAAIVLLLFSFAVGPQAKLLAQLTPGLGWLALLFASILTLGEGMRSEYDDQAMEGLILLPVRPALIFLGKALAHTGLLLLLSLLVWTLCAGLYGAQVVHPWGKAGLLGVSLLGTAAISAPGTLYAALCAQARSRELLLPLLLFPLIVPPLLAAVKATALLMQGDPFFELAPWLQMLAGFNVLYWTLCAGLFGRVVDGW
jgi:heme exporter protein B